ncbi:MULTISPECIES: GNAT family N-acetyltransferase [unclassified Gemella]|uniref:GNAT family N-acetyltransferase n=1 Tax=unclassified Gemella TaxID=2624949 RepID=UPI001C54EE7E|nr:MULTISPECIES: GNAT family N-acetyltransferase [unclassified Gemella]
MIIEYKEFKFHDIDEVIYLYRDAGWSNYYNNISMLENAYKNSLYIYAAYYDNKLIGIIRVVGDGHSIVYIQDIIVLKEFQRKNIGSTLLKHILEDKYSNVYQTVLLTENIEKTKLFYESLNFKNVNDLSCVAFASFKY